MKHASQKSQGNRLIGSFSTIVATILLMVCLVAIGFLLDAIPDLPTQLLSQAYSESPTSTFTKDELVDMALQTKHFTADDNDEQALYATMMAINASAQADGRIGATTVDTSGTWEDFRDSSRGVSDVLVLDEEAISHLDDCYRLISVAKPVLAVIIIVAVIVCILIARSRGSRALKIPFMASGSAILAFFAIFGIWAAADFSGFFAAFHSLFFAADSWYFSAESLLISMYPTEFWIGMGAIWLCSTGIGSIVLIIVGRRLGHHGSGSDFQ